MSDFLTNAELRAAILPRSGDHEALSRLAHKIAGYTVAGGFDECARIADTVRRHHSEFGSFCSSLTDLRISLFFLHRAWRSDFGPPSDGDYAYADALLSAIREQLKLRECNSGSHIQRDAGTADFHYLFGRPVLPAKPIANGSRDAFVLGAYPSALHAAWYGPTGKPIMRAVAVDNEPEPFWNGYNEVEVLREWRTEVRFQCEWGEARPCGNLNGSSGKWLDEKVLSPLGIARELAWITDCLSVYHVSASAAAKVAGDAVSGIVKELGIAPPRHHVHPSEDQIVSRALAHERERLLAEIETARPSVVVTLGNAALRVLMGLSAERDKALVRLEADDTYGRSVAVRIAGQDVELRALAHPAAPARYQAVHKRWLRGLCGC